MQPGEFFRVVDDPACFDFGPINLFKHFYVQFFFGRQVVTTGREWRRTSPRRTPALLLARMRGLAAALIALARLWLRRMARREPRVVFYGATGRLSTVDGKLYDLYNARILDEIGRESVLLIQDADDGAQKVYRPDLVLNSFAILIRLLALVVRLALGKRLAAFGGRIAAAYPALGWTPRGAAAEAAAFYGNYFVDRLILAATRPERALLICHYGREPFIAACKRAGVPVLELQHGSIVGVDTFYRFPANYAPLFARSLFPDCTCVYGEYWRQVVLEGGMFPSSAVKTVGYYLKVPPRKERRDARTRTTVLITTQPTVQAELLDYVRFLATHLDPGRWAVVIKPHPAEDARPYHALAVPGFVSISERSPYELLSECDIHISAYSSVLYEAILYGPANYALYVDRYWPYCDAVVASGVARGLNPDETPAVYATSSAEVRFYMDLFRPAVLME
jgi:hypothetical protein